MRPCRILWHCIVSLLFFSIIGCRETAVPASGKSNQSSDVAPAVNNKDSTDPVNSDSNPSSPNQPQTNTNNTTGGGSGNGSSGGSSNNSTSSPTVRVAGPNSTCGNGVQEITARSSQQCIYDLYGSTINPNDGSSSLYFFDKQTGVGFLIGAITEQLSGVERVGAIDFSPDGVLYGVGIRSLDDKSVLITIDCATGQATIIGETGIESIDGAGQITDIDLTLKVIFMRSLMWTKSSLLIQT